jgi:heptosyltransferase-3
MRILLIVLRRLGDVLLATPLLRSLRRAYPDAAIDVMVYAGQEGMLEGNPDCNEVIAVAPYPGAAGYAALVRQRWRRYDLALTTQTSDRSHLYAFLFARRRVGLVPDLGWSSAWKRASCSAYAVLDDVDTHTVVQNLVLADLLGIARQPEVVPPRAEFEHALSSYAVLHPYPKFNYKQWTPEGWRDLIRWLRREGLQVVLSGGPDPQEVAYNAALAPGEVVDMTGKLTLGALPALYRKARLFIGTDTSATHLAAACGTPTLALFGPTNPVKWGPWPARDQPVNEKSPYRRLGRPWQRAGNVILLQGVQPIDLGSCLPCHREGCERHVGSFSRCLTEMPLDPVRAAARELLR